MTDRPLIFSAPMVRALLNGRKTQTRRALTLGGRRPDYIGPRGCTADPACWGWDDGEGGYILADRDPDDRRAASWHDFASSWRAGDRVWVRESWQGLSYGDYLPTKSPVCDLRYSATDPLAGMDAHARGYPWRPSIHMPRWASRITLQITDVRVQRLQDISRGDAMSEGCPFPNMQNGPDPRNWFRDLWNSLHGADAWDCNPWVCALSFTVQRGNIDQVEGAS